MAIQRKPRASLGRPNTLSVLLSYIPLAVSTLARKVLLTEAAATQNAVCLDGTPGAYYFRPGSGDGKRKWYIHHQGGSWSADLDDALSRTHGHLGSSKSYSDEVEIGNMTAKKAFGHEGWDGYFSQDPEFNPMMYNWNYVFLKYCDGGVFTGLKNASVWHKGVELHFRGRAILTAVQDDLLLRRGLNESTDVVIGGHSAGALAVYLHIDDWADRLAAPGRKVVGMPDSGFVPYYNGTDHYSSSVFWYFRYMNGTGSVNRYCLAAHVGEEEKCAFPEHLAKFIQTPLFAFQSAYDAAQLHFANISVNNTERINEWGRRQVTIVEQSLLAHVPPRHGIFLDSCLHHCFGWGHFHVNDMDQAAAFSKWYHTKGYSAGLSNVGYFKQGMPYPCVECCGGYGKKSHAKKAASAALLVRRES